MGSQETVIGGLLPETTYSVTVAAYTTKGDGARSKPKVITTTGAGECGEQMPQPRGGGGKASQELHSEYGQGTCTGGNERAAEVQTLVICNPYLQALPLDHLSQVQQTDGQTLPGPVRKQ